MVVEVRREVGVKGVVARVRKPEELVAEQGKRLGELATEQGELVTEGRVVLREPLVDLHAIAGLVSG